MQTKIGSEDRMVHEILLEQNYNSEDDINLIKHFIPYFKDEKYILIDGKPVFIRCKQFLLPDASAIAIRWKEIA